MTWRAVSYGDDLMCEEAERIERHYGLSISTLKERIRLRYPKAGEYIAALTRRVNLT